MSDIIICFADKKDSQDIAKLSFMFQEENCCNGIIADTKEYFETKKVAIAKVDEKIVAYCYGNIEITKRDCSMYKQNRKIFYVDEIYVQKEYRNRKIGQMLYDFIENFAKENDCEVIEVTAVSKNYKELLKFYIEKLNMEFWSASLVKKLK